MPFQRQRAELRIDDGVRLELERISRSRTESARRVERAETACSATWPASRFRRLRGSLNTNRPKVYRCVRKALDVGALPALDDLPRRGRPATISAGSRAWLVALACRKPAELGYAEELWTVRRLAETRSEALSGRWASGPVECGPGNGVEDPGPSGGATAQDQLLPGTAGPRVRREDGAGAVFLSRSGTGPRARGGSGRTARGLHLVRTKSPAFRRSARPRPTGRRCRASTPRSAATPEYVRHGTVTLMAGMDLLTGHVHRAVVDRHRSREFVEFLRGLDKAYPKNMTLRLILDNHSAHLSRETRTWLASVPNRFEFVFTPKHASWLNTDRDVLQQSGKNRVAWNPCRLDGRTQGTARTLHRRD